MVKLETALRGQLEDEEDIQKVLTDVASLDVKTPAERSADALEAIQSNIALTGQGGALADPTKGGGGAAFIAGLQESLDASLDFSKAASKHFQIRTL